MGRVIGRQTSPTRFVGAEPKQRVNNPAQLTMAAARRACLDQRFLSEDPFQVSQAARLIIFHKAPIIQQNHTGKGYVVHT